MPKISEQPIATAINGDEIFVIDQKGTTKTVSMELLDRRIAAASVNHATTADRAANADYATNAGHATTTDSATNASHASTADSATNAAHATTADNATTAANASHALTADNATNAAHASNADLIKDSVSGAYIFVNDGGSGDVLWTAEKIATLLSQAGGGTAQNADALSSATLTTDPAVIDDAHIWTTLAAYKAMQSFFAANTILVRETAPIGVDTININVPQSYDLVNARFFNNVNVSQGWCTLTDWTSDMGTYSASASYTSGMKVMYGGTDFLHTWICVNETKGNTPSGTSEYWKQGGLGKITLSRGTYIIEFRAPSTNAGRNRAVLYNASTGRIAIRGSSNYSDQNTNMVTVSFGQGLVTVTDPSNDFYLPHYIQYNHTNNFGVAVEDGDELAALDPVSTAGPTGLLEIYAVMWITKVA